MADPNNIPQNPLWSIIGGAAEAVKNFGAGALNVGGNIVDRVTSGSEGTAPGNELGQSRYDFNYTVFPRDISEDYNGHYCIININVPTKGIKTNGLSVNETAGAFGNLFTPLNQVSKLDTLRYGNYEIPNAPGASRRTALSIPRNTKRIAESICLFMPTPLVFNSHNLYEEISLSALAGNIIGIGTQFATGAVGGLIRGVFNNFPGAAKLAQSPINPAIEVVFANTLQRQFTMEWLMAPRNEAESIAIKKIIQTLRFHAAPEINADFASFMWIPPADFDITFFDKGVENTNVLRINTCVLERCEVQYDPTGVYSTFRNGMPVAVRLSVAFRELEPNHKLRILQGF